MTKLLFVALITALFCGCAPRVVYLTPAPEDIDYTDPDCWRALNDTLNSGGISLWRMAKIRRRLNDPDCKELLDRKIIAGDVTTPKWNGDDLAPEAILK